MRKRLQKLVLAVAMMAVAGAAQGQRLSTYSLTVDTAVFNTIVSTGTAMSFTNNDDGYAVVTLPFAIGFGESSFPAGTPIACSANGFLQLGASSTSGLTAIHINETNCYINAILREDGHLNRYDGAGAYYRYDATAGTFTIEYHLLGRYDPPYGAYSYQIVFHDNSTIELVYDTVDLGGDTACLLATFLTDGPHGDRVYITDRWASPVFSSSTFAFRPTSDLPAHGLRYTLTPPPAACPRPISIVASNVRNNGFDISWVDTSGAGSWLVRVMKTAVDSVVYYNDVTAYPVSIIGLEPNTDYTVSVASLCPNGDTSAFRTMVARTQCEYISVLPYAMGFEVADGVAGTGGMSSNAFVDCWHRLNHGGEYVGIPFVEEGTSARTGSRGLEWHTMDLRSHLVVLPGIDTTTHALRDLYFSFWARVAYPDFYYSLPRLQVGVMTDPEDSTTFQLVEVIDVGNSAVWEEYTVPLSGYTGRGIYVALRSVVSDWSWHAYLDDFALYEAPDCREVVGLTASDVTDSTVDIRWTEIGGASSWLVELVGAGTTLITQMVNDTHVSFAGLTANTQYTVRVAARCLHDTGLWRAITLRTQCTPLDTLPYFYNFEDSPTGSGMVGTCWSHLGMGDDPYVSPFVSYCYGCNHTPDGNKVLNWEYLDSYHLVILPSVDSDRYPVNSLRLRFWAKPSSTYLNNPSFQVGVITNSSDSSTFQPIDTVDVDTRTARWQEYVVSLASYSGTHGRVAIRSNARHTYLDDFTLEPNPTCHPPEELTALSDSSSGNVVVSWTETNAATAWQMVVVGRGENPDTCTTSVTVYNNEVPLQPDADTAYDIYVRSICQEGDTSEWSSPLHLLTSQHVDMDTLGSATLFTCRSLICDPGGAGSPYGSNDHATLYVYPGSPDSVLAFWGTVRTDAFDYLLVYEGIGTDGDLLWSPPAYNSYVDETIPNTISRRGPITLVWHSDEGGGGDGFALNVRCLQRTDCPRPIDFTLVSSYTDIVWVAWHDTAYIGSYQLCHVPVGADPYALAAHIVSVEDTVYAFTNLVRDSAYDIYVRSDCGNEQSWWVGPITVIPGTFFVGTSGSAEITACSLTVYDDGGPMRPASENADYRLTIHAVDPDSTIAIHGSYSTSGSYRGYLLIYDGVDSTGTLLWQNSTRYSTLSGAGEVIPTILSSSDAITLVWHSPFLIEFCDGFELHVDCITPPTCSYVNHPRVSNITSTSALADWDVNTFPLDIEPSYYEVRLTEGDALIRVDTTSTHPYWVSGLSPLHNYNLQVRSVCGAGDRTPWDSVMFSTRCMGGDTAEISGGSITTNTFPTYTHSEYSYTQMLYLSTQVGRGGTIAAIAYHTADSCPPRNVCLYMGEVDRSTFATLLDYIPLSQLHLVYTGTLGGSANSWVVIHLDSLFHYSGMGNMVVALDDNTGTGSMPATFYASENGQSIHWRSNFDINPAEPGLAFGTSIQQNDIRFIMACDTALACLPPNPIVRSITAHEATLSWTPGLNETSWHIAHRAVDDTVWTTDTVGWHSTTYTIAGLDANTQYIFRVAADCSAPLASFVWDHTDCDPQSIPFSVDFETWTPNSSIPYCWHRGSSFPIVTATTSAHSGNNVLYMYSTSVDYSYIVLPLTAAPVDSLQLSFWMRKPNSYYTHEIIVGVMTDPADISTFQPLDTVSCSFVSIWEPFEIALDSYTGTGGRIAILSPNGIRSDPYIDDIEVSYISSCPRPREVYADNLTPTTATLHWSDTLTNNFEIEYGPTGFAHGTGTLLTTTGNSVVLTGLTISMRYDVYVRGICDTTYPGSSSHPSQEGSDTSQWSFVYTFRPSCDLIDNLPWADNLESYSYGNTVTGSDFIPCWNRLNNGTNYGGIPSVGGGYNHTSGGLKSLYWYNNTTLGTYGDYLCVVLPGVDTTINPINSIRLRFWAMPFRGSPTLFLGIMGDPYDITTFQCVDTITLGSNRDWYQVECPFTSFVGRGCHPAIMAVRPTTLWEAYLDDFIIETAPCSAPNRFRSTGNTASTIALNWNERGTATQWQVAVETSPLTSPTPDTLVVSHPITIADLVAGTEYYFYVRSICSEGDTSPWSDALVCVPGSWDMRANQIDTIRMCGGVIYDDGGATGSYSNNQNSLIVIYPDAANNLVTVSGTVSTSSVSDCLTIYDGVGRMGTELSNFFGYSNNRSFGPIVSSSGPITIYFYADGSSYSDGFAINVNCISRTCRVMNVRQDSTEAASDTQLAVIWDVNGADLYEVAWGPLGFAPTAAMTTTYTNRVTITGLTPLTSYDVCVRSICSGTYPGSSSHPSQEGMDTGSWTRATLQTTLCDYVSQHYSYGNTTSTTDNYVPLGVSIYGYSYVQTLIDSAQMAGLTDPINAFAFNPSTTTNGYYYNHIDVYMANVSESDLAGGFIHPDSNHLFVPVITDGDLRYNTVGWQTHRFDTPFIWDGHSNVLFAVNRRHGMSSNGYAASFNAHTTSNVRTRYINMSNTAYNPSTVSGGSASHNVGDLKFMTCGPASCRMPIITGVSHTFENATITWTGEGSSYQVNVKESTASVWPTANISVTGNTYTFTGLQPSTNYTFRIRQDCTADSLGYSEWTSSIFTTDYLQCSAPYDLTASNITNSTATFDWVPIGEETMWQLHVWFSGGLDSVYTVSSHPVTIGGFTANTTYQASIHALCGSAHNIVSDETYPIEFTTAACPDVAHLGTRNITASSVEVFWSLDPMAQTWILEYGYHGFDMGTGTTVSCSTNFYVVTDLDDDMEYDFRVRAVCGSDWQSEGWSSTTATTLPYVVVCDAPTDVSAEVSGNTATISWIAGEGNNSFEIEYGRHGFTHGNSAIFPVGASPFRLSNLSYETEYDVYIHAVCDQNIYSDWSDVVSFTTGSVGIDREIEPACTIYPNPTNGMTTISVSGISGRVLVSVVDINGRVIVSKILDCSNEFTNTLSVENLPHGAYFVRVTGENANVVKKLIVK